MVRPLSPSCRIPEGCGSGPEGRDRELAVVWTVDHSFRSSEQVSLAVPVCASRTHPPAIPLSLHTWPGYILCSLLP